MYIVFMYVVFILTLCIGVNPSALLGLLLTPFLNRFSTNEWVGQEIFTP